MTVGRYNLKELVAPTNLVEMCANSCPHADRGPWCKDDGPGSWLNIPEDWDETIERLNYNCPYGTDCLSCGKRLVGMKGSWAHKITHLKVEGGASCHVTLFAGSDFNTVLPGATGNLTYTPTKGFVAVDRRCKRRR